jgi:hypothetical protein
MCDRLVKPTVLQLTQKTKRPLLRTASFDNYDQIATVEGANGFPRSPVTSGSTCGRTIPYTGNSQTGPWGGCSRTSLSELWDRWSISPACTALAGVATWKLRSQMGRRHRLSGVPVDGSIFKCSTTSVAGSRKNSRYRPGPPHYRGLGGWSYLHQPANQELTDALSDAEPWYPTQYNADASL